MTIDFILNGEDVSLKADPLERLSDLLRERFGLSSLMSDCLAGFCGKCVVYLDGRLVNSCLVPAFKVRGSEVVSFEGFKSTDTFDAVSRAFNDAGAEFCGFCDAAVFMAAGSLLDSAERPGEDDIEETMSTVYCRCSTPSITLGAIRGAVEAKAGGKYDRAR
ncbi:MAG: aldehyde oxidoreductase [Spirochaetes bacterium]|nr:aldehyde oxidoreductase [Spirochaetota bacterium]MBU1080016.1 aldehyde oxidoreductase [Spirochaetota bacterium]